MEVELEHGRASSSANGRVFYFMRSLFRSFYNTNKFLFFLLKNRKTQLHKENRHWPQQQRNEVISTSQNFWNTYSEKTCIFIWFNFDIFLLICLLFYFFKILFHFARVCLLRRKKHFYTVNIQFTVVILGVWPDCHYPEFESDLQKHVSSLYGSQKGWHAYCKLAPKIGSRDTKIDPVFAFIFSLNFEKLSNKCWYWPHWRRLPGPPYSPGPPPTPPAGTAGSSPPEGPHSGCNTTKRSHTQW